MFARLKNIFKKSESGFLTLFWGFGWDKVIKNHEYVNFFVGWQYAAITAYIHHQEQRTSSYKTNRRANTNPSRWIA